MHKIDIFSKSNIEATHLHLEKESLKIDYKPINEACPRIRTDRVWNALNDLNLALILCDLR